MKKLIISVAVVSLFLLSGTYWVGIIAERETTKIFVRNDQQGLPSKLISYKRSFFTATSESEVKMVVDGGETITFNIISEIQHYPYKARMKNSLSVSDVQLNKRFTDYFSRQDWLESEDEINIFGQLNGRLTLPAGRFDSGEEQFSTQALRLDYQVALDDYSGSAQLLLGGLQSQTATTEVSLNAIQVALNFGALAVNDKYEYLVQIATIAIHQVDNNAYLEGLELQGNSHLSENGQNINSSNEWKMGLYQIDNGKKSSFSDNHIKVDIKGLSMTAFSRLNNEALTAQDLAQALADLFAHGLQLTLADLSSQTPWGGVEGELDITLQDGAVLADVVRNPFILLDYISGYAKLQLPETLLEQASFSQPLQAALQAGFLQKQDGVLRLHTQLEQGELTVNGRVIPL